MYVTKVIGCLRSGSARRVGLREHRLTAVRLARLSSAQGFARPSRVYRVEGVQPSALWGYYPQYLGHPILTPLYLLLWHGHTTTCPRLVRPWRVEASPLLAPQLSWRKLLQSARQGNAQE